MTSEGATDKPTVEWPTIDERNIVQRMCAIMGELGAIGKTSQNREQGYAFRGVDAFMNALHPLLAKHGVVVTPKVIDRTSFERDRRNRQGEIVGVMRVVEMLVEFTFHGIDGSTVVAVAAGEGADVADKATNKAMSGALKYAVMQSFMVPTEETIDADAETPEVPPREQVPARDETLAKLDDACAVLGKSRADVTRKWRDKIGPLPVAALEDPAQISDAVLYHYVVSLVPYVEAARAERAKGDDVPEPTDEERAAATNVGDAPVLCDAKREHDGHLQQCTAVAGHEPADAHVWW